MLILFVSKAQQIFASATSSVTTTVKISICGNNLKEGGEDCDNADLHGASCQSLGFGGGTLSCDISCSFNTSACIAPTITPSIEITPTKTSLPTSIPTPTIGYTPTPTITLSQPIFFPTLLPTIPPISPNASFLPSALQFFDIHGIGHIELSQLFSVVKLWVDDWKNFFLEKDANPNNTLGHKNCDINRDGICSMKDFSILMFYVER